MPFTRFASSKVKLIDEAASADGASSSDNVDAQKAPRSMQQGQGQ